EEALVPQYQTEAAALPPHLQVRWTDRFSPSRYPANSKSPGVIPTRTSCGSTEPHRRIPFPLRACNIRQMSKYQIAQVNIARMNASLEDPIMAGFVARLDEINALADGSPGFVWRLQTEAGNATYLRPYEDDRILFNFSIW